VTVLGALHVFLINYLLSRSAHCDGYGAPVFGGFLNKILFSEYWRIQRITVFGNNALYKFTFTLHRACVWRFYTWVCGWGFFGRFFQLTVWIRSVLCPVLRMTSTCLSVGRGQPQPQQCLVMSSSSIFPVQSPVPQSQTSSFTSHTQGRHANFRLC